MCEKVKDGVVMTKTKLEVRGPEEYTTSTYKDIPTCSRVAVHMAFFFTTSNQWVCHTAHIKSCIFIWWQYWAKVWPLNSTLISFNGKFWILCFDSVSVCYIRVKNESMLLSVKIYSLDNFILQQWQGWKNN